MSCFGCCEEDDIHKAAENGDQYLVKNSAGNPLVEIHIRAECLITLHLCEFHFDISASSIW